MILKGDRLAIELEQGTGKTDPLLIAPKPSLDDLRKSGAAGLDLRLGTWVKTMRNTRKACLDILADDEATPHESQSMRSYYMPFGKEFVLHPNDFILGVTLEWIRLPSNMAAYVIDKSKWGRRGLVIATATGVHPGFNGCLTLEISNVGNLPLKIRPGMQICQLFFHEVATSDEAGTKSSLSSNRKPMLGEVTPDRIARILSYKPAPAT